MKGNSNAFHTFLEKVLNALKIKYPSWFPVQEPQAFSNLATSIPCDGIGGTVKGLVGNRSL